MAKLFSSDESLLTPVQAFEARHFEGVDLLTIQDSQASLESLSRLFDKELAEIEIVKQLKYSTEKLSIKYGDDRHLFDNNVKVFDIIQNTISEGKTAMPSMEDFSSQFTRGSSKEIALEGFTDFIKKVWKIIKDFVVSFYNKIILFFKRITGMRLSNDEIKAYIKKNLETIRVNDLKVMIDNTTMITTKLPLMFGGPKADKFKVQDIEMIGLRKISTHLNYLRKINEYYNLQIREAETQFGVLKKLLKDSMEGVKRQLGQINTTIVDFQSLSLENAATSPSDLTVVINMLNDSTLKTENFIKGMLYLKAITVPSEIPEKIKISLDGMASNVTENRVETYYGLIESDSLLSNFGIFMKTITGEEKLSPEVSGVEESSGVVMTKSTALKMTSSTEQSLVLPSDIGVVVKYSVLDELFEKAKILEKFSVKESTVFVEKIGEMVVKHVKALEEIFGDGKLADQVKQVISTCMDLHNKTEDGTVKEICLEGKAQAEEIQRYINILSDKFSKSGHNTLIDISRDLCTKLTTLNHEVATEIFNYVYKCTQEYK